MEQQRRYPRLNLSVEIHWEKTAADTFSDNAPQSGTMKYISVGGIHMLVNENVQVGDVLELEIKLSEGKTVHLKGRVKWVDKYEIIGTKHRIGYEGGLEFLDITDETRREISNFIFDIIQKGAV